MRLAAALLTLLLCTAARAQGAPPPSADAPLEGRNLLWLEPASSVGSLVANLDPHLDPRYRVRLLAASGGYARALDTHRALTGELFVTDHRQGCEPVAPGCNGFTSVRASLGLAHGFGDAPHSGLLLEPRLILGYVRTHAERSDPDVTEPRTSPGYDGFSAQLGLDVGYQWRVGGFYVAPVLGLAVGVSSHVGSIPPFITGNHEVSSRDGTPQLAMGLNLHLLRLGWAF